MVDLIEFNSMLKEIVAIVKLSVYCVEKNRSVRHLYLTYGSVIKNVSWMQGSDFLADTT